MSYVEIIKEHILNCNCDCIAVEVNEKLKPTSSVGRTVCKKAGIELIQAQLQEYGVVQTGEAVFTQGYNLKQKGIIYAATPIWSNGFRSEPKYVLEAYLSTFDQAVKHGFHSITLPIYSLSSGYPANGAIKRAILACQQFISNYPTYNMVIQFALQDDLYIKLFEKQLNESDLPLKNNVGLEKDDVLLLESVDLRLLDDCIHTCMSHPIKTKNYEKIFAPQLENKIIERESYINKLPSDYSAYEVYNELNYIYRNNLISETVTNYHLLKLLLRIHDLHQLV